MKNLLRFSSAILFWILLSGCPSRADHEIRVEEVFSNSVELFIVDNRVAPGLDYTLCYKKKANICAMCVTGPAGNCVGGINVAVGQGANSVTGVIGGLDPNTKYRLIAKNANGARIGQAVEFTTLK
tara:strand:- start:381 stop:758 length:378 start_codon:yes stop_codon:yes gene_type:complete